MLTVRQEAIEGGMLHSAYYPVAVDTVGSIRAAWCYLMYHFVEKPIKRAARRIANSGYWGY